MKKIIPYLFLIFFALAWSASLAQDNDWDVPIPNNDICQRVHIELLPVDRNNLCMTGGRIELNALFFWDRRQNDLAPFGPVVFWKKDGQIKEVKRIQFIQRDERGIEMPLYVAEAKLTIDEPGTYTCDLGDNAFGCRIESNPVRIIEEFNAPRLTKSSTFLCEENGRVTITANNITPGSGIAWKKNGRLIAGQNNATITVEEIGTYTCEVLSVGCGLKSSSTTIRQSATLSIRSLDILQNGNPTDQKTFCSGTNITLRADVTSNLLFPSPSFQFKWYKDGNFLRTTGTPELPGIAQSGRYQIKAQYRDCVEMPGPTATVNFIPRVNEVNILANYSEDRTRVTLSSSVQRESLTYRWRRNGVNLNRNQPEIIVEEGGNYELQISAGECGTAIANYNANLTPQNTTVQIIVNGNTNFCEGENNSTNLRLQLSEGGAWDQRQDRYISWYKNGAFQPQLEDRRDITLRQADESGLYSARVNVLPGRWIATDNQVSINISPSLPDRIELQYPAGGNILCRGERVTFSTNLRGKYTYTWCNENTGECFAGSESFTTGTAGAYYLRVASVNQCGETRSNTVQVSLLPTPTGTISAENHRICPGQTTTLKVNLLSTDHYVWILPDGRRIADQRVIENAGAGTYRVIAYADPDENCSRTITKTIGRPTVKISPSQEDDLNICEGERVTLRALAGSNGVQYEWRREEDNQIVGRDLLLNVTETGTYEVTATFVEGCTATNSVRVTVHTLDIPTITTLEPGTALYEGEKIVLLGEHLQLEELNLTWLKKISEEEYEELSSEAEIEIEEPGSYFLTVENEFGCQKTSEELEVTEGGEINYALNWTETTTFHDLGNGRRKTISSSRSYFDLKGGLLQSQSKSQTDTVLLLSQPIYDAKGRAIAQTLPAPLETEGNAFKYNRYFVLNEDSLRFGHQHIAEGVGNYPNTLGGYYNGSAENGKIASTNLPYNRVEYYDDGFDEQKRSTMAGEVFHRDDVQGDQHTYSKTFPLLQELDQEYLHIRRNELNLTDEFQDNTMAYQGIKNVSRDANGKEAVTFNDKDGKTLATAITEGSGENPYQVAVEETIGTPLYWVSFRYSVDEIALRDYRNFLFLATEEGVENEIQIFRRFPNQNFEKVEERKLKRGLILEIREEGDPVQMDIQIRSDKPFVMRYLLRIVQGDQLRGIPGNPLQDVPDFQYSDPIVATHNGVQQYRTYTDFYFPQNQDVTIESHPDARLPRPHPLVLMSLQKLDQANHRQYIREKEERFLNLNRLGKGFYRLTLDMEESNWKNLPYKENYHYTSVDLRYNTFYYDRAYSFYDNRGRKICEITPNGVQQYRNGVPFAAIDKTTYHYNALDQLIAQDETDAGKSYFIYRKDGQIRFSQNAEQKLHNYFSYSAYDYLGRLIESGEYRGMDVQFEHLLLGEEQEENPCQNQVEIIDADLQNLYQSEDTLSISQALVQRNTQAIVRAGDQILLRGGFQVKSGASFRATVGDCIEEIGNTQDTELIEATDKIEDTIAGLSSGNTYAVTRTYYDYLPNGINESPTGEQEFTRGKIVYTEHQASPNAPATSKTWYSYDEKGQIQWVNWYTEGMGHKSIAYEYDWLGNVTLVNYQPDNPTENYLHQYSYDADQRLQKVETRREGEEWKLQATYSYYTTGGLKRVEIGEESQGIDYAYTIHGWLKKINAIHDQEDEKEEFFQDLFSLELDYFAGDYNANSHQSAIAGRLEDRWAQYSGNISRMSWNSQKPYLQERGIASSYRYTYDDKYQLTNAAFYQLNPNRILESNNGYNLNNVSFDNNGNITHLSRGRSYDLSKKEEIALRNMDYHYEANTNQLLSAEGYKNYRYNAIGQMIYEESDDPEVEDSKYYRYNPHGQVEAVYDSAESLIVSYLYDDKGFRIKKENHKTGNKTYYARDLSGNITAIYEEGEEERQTIKEIPIYGSGRLGYEQKRDRDWRTDYELKDHLGNVHVVFTSVLTDSVYFTDMEEENDIDFQRVESLREEIEIPQPRSGSHVARLNAAEQLEDGSSRGIGPTLHLREVKKGERLQLSIWHYEEPVPAPPAAPQNANLWNNLQAPLFGISLQDNNELERRKWQGIHLNLLSVVPLLKNSRQRNVSKARNISARTRPVFIGGDIDLSHLVVEKWSEEGQLIASEQYPLEDLSPLAEEGQWVETTASYEIGECEGCSIKAYVQTVAERDLLVDDFEIVHEREQLKVVNTKSYYPFGSLLSYAEDSTLSTTANSRRNYQGSFAEWDEESSNYHFQLRSYDPIIGRWMASDPYRQFYSPYVGMGNDPVNMVDPDGGITDDVHINGNSVTIFDTGDSFDRIFVDGEFTGYSGQGVGKIAFPEATIVSRFGFSYTNAIAQQNIPLPTSTSNSFIFGNIFKGAKKVIEGAGKEINNQRAINKSLNPSTIHGDPLKVSKGLKFIGKFGGLVFTAWGILDTEEQYSSGKINGFQRGLEHTSSGIGAIPVIGTSWGVGWESGRAITNIPSYQKWKQNTWLPYRRRILGY